MSPNGAAVSAAAGPDTAGGQAAASPSAGGGAAAVIAARVNGELRDLAYPLAAGDVVEPVRAGSPEGRSILRHSTAHVLAQAVQQLFPDAKLGIGPPVENGFYYDFDVAEPFGPDDLKAIEQRMRQIVKQGQRFSRRVVSPDEARAELALEPYKLELIGLKGPSGEESVEVGGHELTMYDNLDRRTGEAVWTDLCRGPHLPTTRDIPAFQLMRTGGAYWRGSERNPQLQRIYGTAWESREAQEEYLHLLEEAERRDHRRLGTELDLFSFPPEIGSGLRRLPPQGRHRPPDHGGVLAAAAPRGRLRVREQPAHHQVGAVRDLRAPRLVQGEHVPAHAPGGRGLLPQADELPVPHPDLPVPRAVLPRAAAAAVRVRHRVPVREVRGRARPDPGARPDHGRRAHLLHPRAGGRRAEEPAEVRARPAARLRAVRLLPGAVHQGRGQGEVRRQRRGLGARHRDARRGGAGVRAGAGGRPGRGRVLRAEDLGAGPRRHRPHLAAVHHPARLQRAQAVRPGVPGARTAPGRSRS